MDTIHTIGRRKTAVARIYMSKGKGNITVNNREAKDYFTTGTLMYKLNQPFGLVDAEGQYDVKVNVSGGGITGQVEAVRLAIARARTTPPTSGETIHRSSGLYLFKIWGVMIGATCRLSTGRSKKPWIWPACKSTVTTLSAPALVIKFETNFAEIDVLGTTFLSCLAYPK